MGGSTGAVRVLPISSTERGKLIRRKLSRATSGQVRMLTGRTISTSCCHFTSTR